MSDRSVTPELGSVVQWLGADSRVSYTVFPPNVGHSMISVTFFRKEIVKSNDGNRSDRNPAIQSETQ